MYMYVIDSERVKKNICNMPSELNCLRGHREAHAVSKHISHVSKHVI